MPSTTYGVFRPSGNIDAGCLCLSEVLCEYAHQVPPRTPSASASSPPRRFARMSRPTTPSALRSRPSTSPSRPPEAPHKPFIIPLPRTGRGGFWFRGFTPMACQKSSVPSVDSAWWRISRTRRKSSTKKEATPQAYVQTRQMQSVCSLAKKMGAK